MGSVTPSASPKPLANAVLPVPMSPASTMRSPRRVNPARHAAMADVVASESERRCNMTVDDARGSRLRVPPVDAPGDAAHHFVADRAEAVGPVGRLDRVTGLAADQHGLVADRDFVVTAVDHHLIHR